MLQEGLDWLLGNLEGLDPDGLAAAILAAPPDQLDPLEGLSLVFSILVAGIDTTVNLIGNALAAFAEHPNEWARLRSQPTLATSAVEEALRYDTPTRSFFRRTVEPCHLGTAELPAGSGLAVLFGAANRDPDAFEDPDRFDIGRSPNDHLGFGSGIHLCLGAPLARLEGVALLTELAATVAAIEPAGQPARHGSTMIRGFEHLPLRLVPG